MGFLAEKKKEAALALIGVVVALLVLRERGTRKTLLIALMIASAYINALLLADVTRGLAIKDRKRAALLVGALLSNGLLGFVMDFDPVLMALVWLPAIAGVGIVLWNRRAQ